MRPNNVNILGQEYTIVYVDKPSEVDIFKRSSLWGQIDFWTRSIRVYANGRSDGDIMQTILHEVLHGITTGLHMSEITSLSNEEDVIDLLALALADFLTRNGWIKS